MPSCSAWEKRWFVVKFGSSEEKRSVAQLNPTACLSCPCVSTPYYTELKCLFSASARTHLISYYITDAHRPASIEWYRVPSFPGLLPEGSSSLSTGSSTPPPSDVSVDTPAVSVQKCHNKPTHLNMSRCGCAGQRLFVMKRHSLLEIFPSPGQAARQIQVTRAVFGTVVL